MDFVQAFFIRTSKKTVYIDKIVRIKEIKKHKVKKKEQPIGGCSKFIEIQSILLLDNSFNCDGFRVVILMK
jgi:hypothetical protein